MCRAPTVGRTWQYNNICFPEPFLNIILPWLECQIIPHSRTCEPSLRSYIQGGARCFNYISFISFFFFKRIHLQQCLKIKTGVFAVVPQDWWHLCKTGMHKMISTDKLYVWDPKYKNMYIIS